MVFQDFLSGNAFDAHEFFGAHIIQGAVIFRVYAPNAYKVCLIGSFSKWQEMDMTKTDYGLYELSVKEAKVDMMYKYRIYTDEHTYVDHNDPYGVHTERMPNTASIIFDVDEYEFTDAKFMSSKGNIHEEPLNIYEMHLGGWKDKEKVEGKIEEDYYNYRDIADMLTPYLKEHFYNAVEIMPLCEYPNDLSWGYQSTGFFAPTSRYGNPSDLQYLIDTLHKSDIKVILDFVPVHFAIDGYALAKFDGSNLYEYPDGDMCLSEWGSYNFDHGKGEVASFLKSSVNYWVSKYHFDGVRMDAISRMIYYHGDKYRGVNKSSVEFIKSMNKGLKQRHKNVILIAEDSTDYPNITRPVDEGGLGFDYKWDMGWMNDTLEFFRKSPHKRSSIYHKITFSMMYFHNEKYMLALSHDENVHSKATIIQKMYGNYEDKFPQARAMYMYMMSHPGKKLNFMGTELAQFREFDETRGLDEDILKYPIHDAFNKYIKHLNKIYLENDSLYKIDYDWKGFEWLIVEDMKGVTYSYARISKSQIIVCLFNFSGDDYIGNRYELRCKTMLRELLNTDWDIYGGKTPYVKDNKIRSICENRKEKITMYYDDFSTPDDLDTYDSKDEIGIDHNQYFKHYMQLDLPRYSGRLFLVENDDTIRKYYKK